MAMDSIAGHEERTRVICHLPMPNPRCFKAIKKVLQYVEGLRAPQRYDVLGYTHSTLRPPAFYGGWWSAGHKKWMREKVVLCTIDYRIDFNDPAVPAIIAKLKETIHEAYCSIGEPQEEVWVVAHHIVR